MSSDNQVQDYGANKALVNKPLQWTDLALSEQVKGLRFFRDKDNNIVVFATMGFDPTQTGVNVLPMGRVGISDPGALNTYARVNGNPNASFDKGTLGLMVNASQLVYNNSIATKELEMQRTPNIFKSQGGPLQAAGAHAVWTPVAGKKFRLMGGFVTLCKDSACAGAQWVSLQDNAVDIMRWDISTAALVATGNQIVFPIEMKGNGFLSAAINQVLNVTFNGAFTAGGASVFVFGTEE